MTPKINFLTFGVHDLPPAHRTPFFKGWINSFLSQMHRLNGIFQSYIDGNTSAYYDISYLYSIDEETVYKYKAYKSLKDSNLGIIPDTDGTSWQLISDSFIGMRERSRYNFHKLTLEYALNRYFKYELDINGYVGFFQPDDPINPTPSDIYITQYTPTYTSFVSGIVESESSLVFTDHSTGWVFTNGQFIGQTNYLFNVNIPISVYASINSDAKIADKIIREFLNKYIMVGTDFNITTY